MGLTEGHQIFVDALTRFAEQSHNARLTPIIVRIAAPLRIAVLGRDGVGRGTVEAALAESGVTVTPDAPAADVHVLVIAETLKPEDHARLADADRPIVMVLNKADLTGLGDGGPLVRAHRRAADCRALTGVPTVPMVGLLATAHLDDELMTALRVLVTEPADLTSTDAFVGTGHSLRPELRQRLLATLDRFGIACAVLALGEGADDATVPDGAAAGQPSRQGRRAHRGGGCAGALPAAAVGDHRIAFSRTAIRRRSTNAFSVDRRDRPGHDGGCGRRGRGGRS